MEREIAGSVPETTFGYTPTARFQEGSRTSVIGPSTDLHNGRHDHDAGRSRDAETLCRGSKLDEFGNEEIVSGVSRTEHTKHDERGSSSQHEAELGSRS